MEQMEAEKMSFLRDEDGQTFRKTYEQIAGKMEGLKKGQTIK
jgi:hypothetical protein